ncbi:hypothetical protein Dsin_013948 [Dipteronia sinensis]|uniref:Reverse transcriptase domain-containing protein n=1 Tax=Dipteronia sinensis TaxID=43782 RepID=A0AAE0ALD5_9ROSI|nr:hypothetical protein Dsin_013948 [Dipteronia sinensis]
MGAKLLFSMPWCIGGDFNTVINASERRGGEFNKWSGRAFNNFILQAKVVDIPMQGAVFTWSNNRVEGSWARLDRFLVSPIMLSWFPNMMQTGHPRTISDHGAITLCVLKADWGPRPFRIDIAWLKDKELMAEVKKNLAERKVRGSSSCTLQTKLRVAKSNIKRWAVSRVKDVGNTKEIEDRLAKIDSQAARNGWSDLLRKERLGILSELWKALRLEEQCWKQRSKPEEIQIGVAYVFEDHYRNVLWSRPKIRSLPVKKLSRSESEYLEEKFSKEEVWVALTSCDGNKALGPDGFKENWSVICDDFMLFMEDFHRDGSIVKELNKTFIALIPKCVKPMTMKDFRPISLVGSFYKILAKVLANRMRKVINSVIGETQMAFVKSHQILDSFVVAEEIIHHWRKRK